jgi:hypothetical protein
MASHYVCIIQAHTHMNLQAFRYGFSLRLYKYIQAHTHVNLQAFRYDFSLRVILVWARHILHVDGL